MNATAEDMLLNERKQVDRVNYAADTVINAAYEAHSSLLAQRSALSGTNRRLGNVSSMSGEDSIGFIDLDIDIFPDVTALIGKIQVRKRRDAIIIGGVVGFCLFILMMYIWR